MDLFLPWANAMLVEQIDNELPVKWTDLAHRCSTVKDLALELVKFFDINIHWKHRVEHVRCSDRCIGIEKDRR